jgi:twitching motility protein PilJ
MASSTQYAQRYQQAVSAYMQGHYDSAETWTDALLLEHPDDPNLQLLCGHINSCLQKYDLAQRHYQQVLQLAQDRELLDCAQSSLLDIAQVLGDSPEDVTGLAQDWSGFSSNFDADHTQIQVNPKLKSERRGPFNDSGSDSVAFEHSAIQPVVEEQPSIQKADSLGDFFEDEVLESSSDFFDEDEEITLLMGRKNSQKLEGVMPDEQFSGELPNLNHHSVMQPSEADLDGFESKHEEPIDHSSAAFGPDDQGEEYEGMLASSEDETGFALLDDFETSDPMNTTADFGLQTEFNSASWANEPNEFEDGIASSGQPNTSLHLAESSLVQSGAGAPVLSATKMQSDRAALNMASRRFPLLRPFEDASLQKKQIIMAASTAAVSTLVVLAGGQVSGGAKIGIGLAAGLAGGATTFVLSQVITRQLKASTGDLQAKLLAVGQGDWGVKAIEFSEDEFGQLAKSFNQMTQFIESSTKDTQRKADEQEKAKEDLQRQVIRLLDDVEGAARGDLTVQAEVTADILGAVADSFNLTIYNLQKIVKQVKVAAREVNRGAADNEEFARGLSSDALRQAEELAATLNSVQMMTSSIQEVADSARAADNVAQRASEAALRGGESVESTVAGILQIRETVAETTRKVKRLAESSQEISKIVGVISQIASRTNLLALNASIEAARAGESGRGFAVVADEVRQLADRAAKASKEIEQIVLQIQGETSSVMTAMEEGTQQVIEGTQRAEQAKHSLNDIIEVSDQIKKLVGSITKATSEQTETSRYVAQVMQSVELTAQETSQEAQRVSDSLRSLVGVARDLQSSVERFKVEGTEFS